MSRSIESSLGISGQYVLAGSGCLSVLPQVLADLRANRALVVASTSRYSALSLPALLHDVPHRLFSGFSSNPQIDDVLAGCALREAWRPDCVVGIGGGSAMDVAKLVRLLPSGRAAALRAIAGHGGSLVIPQIPMVLVPTTAGSGSEATQFATLYADREKLSLDNPRAAACAVILDPSVVRSCSAEVMTACAFDALCHAIESYWSLAATAQSRDLAAAALASLAGLMRSGLPTPTDAELTALVDASHLAGQAINVTRTTAAHGFSYRLTAHFGVPHGAACMLNIQWVFAHNLETLGARALRSAFDDRDQAWDRLEELASLLGMTNQTPLEFFANIMTDNGWSARLREYGVRSCDLSGLADAGIAASSRTRNNPVPIDRDVALGWLARVY